MKQVDRRHTAPIPTESEEQQAVFEWAAWHQGKYPKLELLHHIPNGGSLAATGKRVCCLLVKERPSLAGTASTHARATGLSLAQTLVAFVCGHWPRMQRLEEQGYCVQLCKGADAAIAALEEYLKL